MNFETSEEFALQMDAKDDLAKYRDRFYIPQTKDNRDQLYFTGNSLGLQPKSVAEHIEVELRDWRNLGVEGHFHGENPWFYYHKFFNEKAAKLVGANPSEVVIMNNLTVNCFW